MMTVKANYSLFLISFCQLYSNLRRRKNKYNFVVSYPWKGGLIIYYYEMARFLPLIDDSCLNNSSKFI